jgi:micrococcal nuclease
LVDVAGVVDGDTIRIRFGGVTERVRLIGIDTPELNPPECYGQKAASAMQSLVQGKQVVTAADPSQADRDQYGRLLRHVYLIDGKSVALALIGDGFGKEYTHDKPYAGQSAYRTAQEGAQAAGRGLWGAECGVAAAGRGPAPDPDGPSNAATCDIKGNISSNGEKIYHLPGQRYYDETKIDEAKGERWFCSAADAEAEGWRAAKV